MNYNRKRILCWMAAVLCAFLVACDHETTPQNDVGTETVETAPTTQPEETVYTDPEETIEQTQPQATQLPEQDGPDMIFSPVEEQVTAKIEVNLRDMPSQGKESKVLHTLENGEKAVRTGISVSGWSRLSWKGKTCYAVSSYLTTDLDYKPPVQIQTPFQTVDEQVTAKEAVNLRTLPSTTHPDVKIVVKLENGQVVKRTGINEDVGWSRVEWEGQTLYCISSYLRLAEETELQ